MKGRGLNPWQQFCPQLRQISDEITETMTKKVTVFLIRLKMSGLELKDHFENDQSASLMTFMTVFVFLPWISRPFLKSWTRAMALCPKARRGPVSSDGHNAESFL